MYWIPLILLILLHFALRHGKFVDGQSIIFFADVIIGFCVLGWYTSRKVMRKKLHLLRREHEKLQLAFGDEHEQTNVFNTIKKILDVMGEEQSLEQVLHRVVDTVSGLLHADILVLQLYSDEERRFFMRILKGRKEIDLGPRIKEDIIDRGQSHLINNLRSFPKYRKLNEQGFTSIVIAPLKRRKKVIGLIAALSEKEREFSDQELDVLTMVADQAGLIVENAHLFEKTKLLSITDGLTNIYNHRHFQDRVAQEMEKAKARNESLSLIMGDVDYFKNYNDSHGHPEGDKVLRKIADILKENTKGSDLVARYGGEEFVIVLPFTSKENATKVAENIRKRIEEYKFPYEETQPNKDLTLTLGLANYPEDAQTVVELIKEADHALYQGKEKGRNRLITA